MSNIMIPSLQFNAPPKEISLVAAKAQSMSQIAGLRRAGSHIARREKTNANILRLRGHEVLVEIQFTEKGGRVTKHSMSTSTQEMLNLRTSIGELYKKLSFSTREP